MKIKIHPQGVLLWLSARDTAAWARKPGAHWPCSEVEGKRVFAAFDRNGLCDVTVDGKDNVDVPVDEFNAITSDFLASRLPKDHPCYFVTVGQFRSES